MSFIPDSSQLRGTSYCVAELFGKPHLGCHYEHDDAHSHRLNEGARCAICGRTATNAHHTPPLGAGGKNRHFILATPVGRFVLKPALIAVCGSGATGCHNGFHGGARYRLEWEWDSDENAEKWWNGYWLSHGYEPHSEDLFELGYYVLRDMKDKQTPYILRGERWTN